MYLKQMLKAEAVSPVPLVQARTRAGCLLSQVAHGVIEFPSVPQSSGVNRELSP